MHSPQSNWSINARSNPWLLIFKALTFLVSRKKKMLLFPPELSKLMCRKIFFFFFSQINFFHNTSCNAYVISHKFIGVLMNFDFSPITQWLQIELLAQNDLANETMSAYLLCNCVMCFDKHITRLMLIQELTSFIIKKVLDKMRIKKTRPRTWFPIKILLYAYEFCQFLVINHCK